MFREWIDKSLQRKFLTIVLVIVCISVFISAAIITHYEMSQWERFFNGKAHSLGAYLADISKDGILDKDYLQLDNIVKKINNDPEIIYAIIYDNHGKAITSIFASLNLKSPIVEKILSENSHESDLSKIVLLIRNKHISSTFSVPILMDQEQLGHVDIALSKDMIHQGIQHTIYGIIVANILSFLIALFLISRLQDVIVRPVVNLALLMGDVSKKKDYSLRVDVHSRDELGLLAKCFNDMLEQIQKWDAEIQWHRKCLEEEVAQRTKELAGVNNQLKREKESLQKANEALSKERAAILNVMRELETANRNLQMTQAQLVQSEKMASLGMLAAGVAHEINNPLGFIISNLEVLKTYLQSYNKIIDAVDILLKEISVEACERVLKLIDKFRTLQQNENMEAVIKDINPLLSQTCGGLDRVKKIVLDLKIFAHADARALVNTDLNKVMDNSINICWNELKYKAELIKDFGQILLVECNEQKMEQVFINILVNAAQAIENRGEIKIATYMKDNKVCVQIKDNGKGILPEHLDKIFDPFFTTKPPGKGTGLGLSVSYDIVKQHGGDIVVESKPGQGTTFTILLPVQDQTIVSPE